MFLRGRFGRHAIAHDWPGSAVAFARSPRLLESRAIDPSGVADSDRGEALHRCLGRLGPPARELLQMKYSDGLSAAAIADRQRRTSAAVYQNLCRIHRALRDCVEKELTGQEAPSPRGVQS